MPRPEATPRKARRVTLRPSMEGLEPRLLMASVGRLDPSFGGGSGYIITPVAQGAMTVLTGYTQTVVEPDNSLLIDGPVGSNMISFGTTFGVIHLTASGAADTSFGTGGEANVPLPAGLILTSSPTDLLRQADGKILMVGLAETGLLPTSQPVTIVARFDANGSVDPTFGTAGVVVLDQAAVGSARPLLPHAALQADGKIVLVGSSTLSGDITQVASVRLTATGSLDPSYGTNGLVTIDDIPDGTPTPVESSESVALQNNGQIVILATIASTLSSGNVIDTPVLIRLNADGSRDTSLSQAGLLASYIVAPISDGLIIQANGKFLILGRANGINFGTLVLLRLNADGSFEKETGWFGTGAEAYLARESNTDDLALEPDGKILMTGSVPIILSTNPIVYGARTFVAFQSTANLDPDPSFGVEGVSALNLSQSTTLGFLGQDYLRALSIAVGPNGRPIVIGSDFEYPPSELVVARLTDSATPGDFTGDGISDPALYLPAYGDFAIGDSSGKTPGKIVPFGIAGPGQTIPAPGDYYQTGQDDIAAYLPSIGVYAIQDPSGATTGKALSFGIPGAGQTIPAPGDYYGTGQDDVAVYLPALGAFAIQDPTGKTPGKIVRFGMPGIGNSIPVPGDYDNSGQTELAVYLPTLGAFAYRPAKGGPDVIIPFGLAGLGKSIPVPGDYDGSGQTDLAVYIPSLGVFLERPSSGGAVVTSFGVAGAGQTLPAPGDYDGSGRTELAAYLPAYAAFAYRPASGAPDIHHFIGVPGSGQSIPVSTVVLSPFPGTGSGVSIRSASLMGEPDTLDFLPTVAQKPKSGD